MKLMGIIFVGLLSCYGNEMGMMEDVVVGVEDLRFVSLRFVSSQQTEGAEPSITVDRSEILYFLH